MSDMQIPSLSISSKRSRAAAKRGAETKAEHLLCSVGALQPPQLSLLLPTPSALHHLPLLWATAVTHGPSSFIPPLSPAAAFLEQSWLLCWKVHCSSELGALISHVVVRQSLKYSRYSSQQENTEQLAITATTETATELGNHLGKSQRVSRKRASRKEKLSFSTTERTISVLPHMLAS